VLCDFDEFAMRCIAARVDQQFIVVAQSCITRGDGKRSEIFMTCPADFSSITSRHAAADEIGLCRTAVKKDTSSAAVSLDQDQRSPDPAGG
jgi:hypothetical protein